MSSRDADPPERDDFWLFEHAGWEKAASKYEACWTDLTRGPVPELLAAVAARPEKSLLDVCCGPGYVSEAAARLGAVPIGVDFSGNMLRRTRERNAGLPLVQGDAQRLARQTPERLEAIRAEIEKAVQPFASEAGYSLPMAATVVAAVAR